MGNGIGSFLKRYMEFYNISGVDFAESLGITPKHLSEIINKNIDISDDLVLAISLVTDFDVAYILKLEENKKIVRYLNNKFGNKDNLKEYLKEYYLNELVKKNWITLTHKEDAYSNASDLLKFFRLRNFDIVEDKINNTLFKKGATSDNRKIILWISRCEELTRRQIPNEFEMSNIKDILEFLKVERKKKLNIDNLIKYFNLKGLYLVIEEALPGTKIRGASKVKRNKPAIYLTKLYKDKASFYFALYHELGHIKKHYSMAKNKYIIDGEDNLEKEADEFALKEMVPEECINYIINGNNIEVDSLVASKRYDVPMCFIVRCLAKSRYIKYSSDFYNRYIEKI